MITAAVIGTIVIVAAAAYLVLRKPSTEENIAPGFTISVSPSTLTIPRGGSDNLTITFQGTQLPENLGVVVYGLPQWVQYTGAPGPFAPPQPPTTFILTFTVADNVTIGSYPAGVVCEDMSSTLTGSDNFTLVITT